MNWPAAIIAGMLTGRVLMLGWMNEESLRRTRESGEVWFWSRSRQAMWRNDATSDNVMRMAGFSNSATVLRCDACYR